MRLSYLIVFITIFSSCKIDNEIVIYTDKSTVNDVVIRGNNLKTFFTKEKYRVIQIDRFSSFEELDNELKNLKLHILENGYNDNFGGGIYYNAIIHGKDTLYSSGFKAWKYRNKTILYENDLIEKTFKKFL